MSISFRNEFEYIDIEIIDNQWFKIFPCKNKPSSAVTILTKIDHVISNKFFTFDLGHPLLPEDRSIEMPASDNRIQKQQKLFRELHDIAFKIQTRVLQKNFINRLWPPFWPFIQRLTGYEQPRLTSAEKKVHTLCQKIHFSVYPSILFPEIGNVVTYLILSEFLPIKDFAAVAQVNRLGRALFMKAVKKKTPIIQNKLDKALFKESHYLTKEKIKSLEKLLQLGANPNFAEERFQRTALMMAAAFGNQKAINLLVQNGADVTATDCKGRRWVSYAVFGIPAFLDMTNTISREVPHCDRRDPFMKQLAVRKYKEAEAAFQRIYS
jgi:hypothetical protein